MQFTQLTQLNATRNVWEHTHVSRRSGFKKWHYKHRQILCDKSRKSCVNPHWAIWASFERQRPDVQCNGDYFCHVEVRKTHSQVNIDASDA